MVTKEPSSVMDGGKASDTAVGSRPQRSACTGETVWQALRAASAWLDLHVDSINSLNVFPVPDGDTGTNMSLTMRAAIAEVTPAPNDPVSDTMRAVSQGALMGARGNSGVILSQILRGVARALDGKRTIGPQDLVSALAEGADTAYQGVMKPVEGTILTVAREAARMAERAADNGATLCGVLETALEGAQSALALTPSLLPVLAEAGVVDAGGQGLVRLLEGALRQVQGQEVEMTDIAAAATHTESAGLDDASQESLYNYDTQFIITGDGLDVSAIRDYIATMGDSVLVVGDELTVKVHVHCDLPGKALDYGISQGMVSAIIIENMQLQYEEFRGHVPAATPPSSGNGSHTSEPLTLEQGAAHGHLATPETMTSTSVIAVASGEGLQRILESIGVSQVVSGGQTMNPSAQDLLDAIDRAPSDRVIVLPNNSNIVLAACQARDLSDKKVVVIPTRSIPEGIAAMLAFNYQADLDTNADLMQQATSQVQTAEITSAVRSVQVNGLQVREGDIIGLVDGDLKTSGHSVPEVMLDLVAEMDLAERDIVTLYYGQGITEEQAEDVVNRLGKRYPDAEIECLDGGQAYYHYIISAE